MSWSIAQGASPARNRPPALRAHVALDFEERFGERGADFYRGAPYCSEASSSNARELAVASDAITRETFSSALPASGTALSRKPVMVADNRRYHTGASGRGSGLVLARGFGRRASRARPGEWTSTRPAPP